MVKIIVVIPALNEDSTIADVIRRVPQPARTIVVDDGSTDQTVVNAERAGAEVVRHDRNRGYDDALASGFARAIELGADAIVSIDADGQHDLEILKHVFTCFENMDTELVIGVREHQPRWAERLFGAYTRLRFGVPDILCGLKGVTALTYQKYGRLMDYPSIHTAMALAALRDKCRYDLVEVPIHPRQDEPRFSWTVNVRILAAFSRALIADFLRR
ncbi:MAG: glycosyltransferase family 2 protein [Rhodospirillaceae bacterium]|nr:glycosyltransferase family 2 protein [Rhodospirillaceae bacterium]